MKALKKLIPAAAMLLLCAAMMTTATFAWFNMNNAVKVGSITSTVTAPVNLQVGNAIGGTWDVSTTVATPAGAVGLNPVTTSDMSAWKTTNKGVQDTGVASGKLSTLTLDTDGKCTVATKDPTPSTDATLDDQGDWQTDKYFFLTYTIFLKNIGGTATNVYIDTGANTSITPNSVTTGSPDLMKAVAFAADVTVADATQGTAAAKQYFVQDADDTIAAITGYSKVVKGAVNDAPIVNIAPQGVATVKITAWMAGDSKYCTMDNIGDAVLKFDFALGFTTVAPTATS